MSSDRIAFCPFAAASLQLAYLRTNKKPNKKRREVFDRSRRYDGIVFLCLDIYVNAVTNREPNDTNWKFVPTSQERLTGVVWGIIVRTGDA